MMYFLCFVLLLLIYFIFLKKKKKKKLLKSNKFYYFSKVKLKKFCSVCMMLNYYNFDNMKNFKNLKQLKLTDHIISCILYNSPVTYKLKVDKVLLSNFGIDLSLPIVYLEQLDKFFISCLKLALKVCKCNIVINEKLINKTKNFKNIKYLILNTQYCNLKLFNCIYSLNIYKKNKFKIKTNNNNFEFEITSNKNKLLPILKISNNCICERYNDDSLTIDVEKFSFDGKYIRIEVKNTNDTKTINIKYNINLSNNYYEFTNVPHGLEFREVINNNSNFVLCDEKLNFLYPQTYGNNLELPFLHALKTFKVLKNQTKTFTIYIGDNNKKIVDIKNAYSNYQKKITNLLNCKIKCSDKKLEYMFNFYLPNRIILDNINVNTHMQYNFKSYEEAYYNFVNKNISALQYYQWLKHIYFGIVDNKESLKIKPLQKSNFSIYYQYANKNKVIQIVSSNDSKKYVLFDNVKYFNCNAISKQNLNKIDDFIVVV